jgi:hypothetical protein
MPEEMNKSGALNYTINIALQWITQEGKLSVIQVEKIMP